MVTGAALLLPVYVIALAHDRSAMRTRTVPVVILASPGQRPPVSPELPERLLAGQRATGLHEL